MPKSNDFQNINKIRDLVVENKKLATEANGFIQN